MPRKNPVAKNLQTRRYRPKLIKSKKLYNRKRLNKHD